VRERERANAGLNALSLGIHGLLLRGSVPYARSRLISLHDVVGLPYNDRERFEDSDPVGFVGRFAGVRLLIIGVVPARGRTWRCTLRAVVSPRRIRLTRSSRLGLVRIGL
jgi:hypothetical protein